MRRQLLGLLIAIGFFAGCISTAPPAASPLAAAGGAPAAPAAAAAPATSTSASGTTVNVATPSTPCCPHQTLWQFLGIKNAFTDIMKLIEALRNCLGSTFPGLESVPPLTAITNPANMNSSNPAIAAAAGAKADEDQAGQKIKAIRYLATLGCAGCYPDIEDALLASLDDCTEAVRYEAAKAFRELSGRSCSACKTKSCCSPKVRKKLDEVANKKEKNCYKEPSERVRRMARLALAGCGGGATPTPAPQEGPSENPPQKGKLPAKTAADDDQTTKALAALVSNLVTPASANAASAPGPASANDARPASSVQVRVSQTPLECGCGVNQSASVFIPASSAAASNQQPTPAAPANPSSEAVAAIPAIAASILKAALPAPAPAAVGAPPTANANLASVVVANPTASSAVHAAAPASGAVLAEINGRPIFESEVVPEADRQLADLPAVAPAEKLRIRAEYIRRQLARVIDRKLLAQEARRTGPQINQASFQAAGNDESALADALIKAVVRVDTNTTPEQLWTCYRVNQQKFVRPAEVRFEQVSVRIDRFASRDAAVAAMSYVRNRALGNPVGQPPANLEAIHVQTSGWVRRDDIPSPAAAELLFRIPVGGISPLLDSGDTLHIDRVLERHAAGLVPLEQCAEAVRQQILRERREYLQQAYLSQLRSRAQIWTIFDPPRTELKMVRPLDAAGGR
ncbi:MAG TPA: peptidylprolyl isomerase [Pirellulales bacterium]|nr:peptidylprolyl isomerase [Pirellulales bacterium]